MSDLFSDEDEVSNIFDEEEEEDDDEDSKEPETTEELDLAELGIVARRFKGFKKRYPKKKIFYGGNITKNAFIWYINNCSMEELEAIKEEKLPKGFDKILAKKFTEEIAQKLEKEEKEKTEIEELPEEDKKTISGYIEQSKKLRKQIETQKETINTILGRSETYYQYMNFLYNLMGEKMVFKTTPLKCPSCKETFFIAEEKDILTDEEIAQIDKIDEVVTE